MTRELIVLHAGLHKTGSSSIQATLQGYDDGTTRYADLGSPNHSKFFDSAFSDTPKERWDDAEKTHRAERWHKRLLRETTTDRPRLIFSGEAISVLGPSGVTRMVDFFAPHARQLRVVAYARDPRSYIASSFQQRIKFGVSEFRIPQQRPFFRERLSPFFEILGKEAVEVVPFLSFAKTGKDVVEDFCTRAGVTPAQIVRSNESMSADAIRLIYLWNKGSGETVQGPARKRLIAVRGSASPFVAIWDQDLLGIIEQGVRSSCSGIFNVAGDGALSMREIADLLGKPLLNLPAPLLKTVLALGKLSGLGRYGPAQVNFLRYRPVLDNTRLKGEFGYTPQKTSREVFEYFIEHARQRGVL